MIFIMQDTTEKIIVSVFRKVLHSWPASSIHTLLLDLFNLVSYISSLQ